MLAALVDVAHVGLPLLGLLIAAESAGAPLPGETGLIAAALLASQGKLPIEGVIAVAAAGAIVGDNIGYAIGRRGGRRLLNHRRLRGRGERLLAVGEPFFARHGPKAVFLGRFVAVLRIGASWLAGINGMPWRTFLVWNALGGICWATAIGLLAYALGASAQGAIQAVGLGGAGLVLALGIVIWAVGRVRRRRRRGEPASEAGSRGAG